MAKDEKPSLRENTKYKSTIGGKEEVQFDYSRAAPGMADLMRRLYQVRIDCGAIEVDRDEEAAKAQHMKTLRKMDLFERTKVEMKELLDETRGYLEDRAKGEDDPVLKKNLIKNMSAIDKLYKELDKIQLDAMNKKNIWGQVKMSQELKEQRDADLKLIHKHIQQMKKEHKRLLMGKSRSDDDKGKRKHKKIEFDSVDNMKDMSKQEELPQIDISYGLEQIAENKKREDVLLDKLLEQLGQIDGVAREISDELDVQLVMLDKLQNDVDKHVNTLGTVNKNLDKLIEEAGGSTKLLVIGILVIIVIALVGIGFLFLKVYLLK
jgi:hypothetical protein